MILRPVRPVSPMGPPMTNRPVGLMWYLVPASSRFAGITTGGPPGALTTAAAAQFPGGQIPSAMIDPNMVALMKLYPAANASSTQTGGFNYVQAPTFNQNNDQWMSRLDYSISDNTKLFVRYNLQRETQQF